MVRKVVDLGATVLAEPQEAVAGFLFAKAAGARVGVVGVYAVSNSADGFRVASLRRIFRSGAMRSIFACERSLVSNPVDIGVDRDRPVVAGVLVELERRKAMSGGEVVADNA
jgi:hypothetical protein